MNEKLLKETKALMADVLRLSDKLNDQFKAGAIAIDMVGFTDSNGKTIEVPTTEGAQILMQMCADLTATTRGLAGLVSVLLMLEIQRVAGQAGQTI